MVISTSYEIENDKEFVAAIDKAFTKVSDLTFAWKRISEDWRKSNNAQFTLQSSGLYPPLSDKYAARKAKLFPGKPILVATERLKKSVTVKSHKDHINVIKKSGFIFGTRTPYGIFHQSDDPRSLIPQRKFLFIGPESPQAAKSIRVGRLERFVRTIEDEVQSQLDAL